MSPSEIEKKKNDIIKKFGEWTAHNIRLKDDVYTIGKKIVGDEVKLRRVVQSVADLSGRPIGSLRLLDLACLEGLYALEFALHGARVTAIEGRKAGFEKVRFVQDTLGLDNLTLCHDDIRNLSREKYGTYDVVLCLGILYHLDSPDVFHFVRSMKETCDGFAVIDTHISLKPETSYTFEGRQYWGSRYLEHSQDSTAEERERSSWASLDNLTSFWFTRPSLLNLLTHAGFTSVYECHVPEEVDKVPDRVTLIAVSGRPLKLVGAPLMNEEPARDYPEERPNKP